MKIVFIQYFIFLSLLVPRILYSQSFKNIKFQNEIVNCLVENGLSFVGKPYIAGTMDSIEIESLVCRNDAFDCVTFVEYVLALTMYQCQISSTVTIEEFLTDLRYREGKIDGYGSRLHYFTEWLDQSQANGLLYDVSKDFRGELYHKKINFISKHFQKYPAIKNPKDKSEILDSENRLSKTDRYYIPKDRVKFIESKLEEGDVIAITTGIDGLDVVHTGFIKFVNGDARLLHASERYKKVMIDKLPLHKYLSKNKNQTGIIVSRMRY